MKVKCLAFSLSSDIPSLAAAVSGGMPDYLRYRRPRSGLYCTGIKTSEDGLVVPVAVNISSLQFRREGFLADVQEALDDAGLPPELLELEVTESVLLDGAEQAITLINELKAMGIRVALDDFGTGFSSLSYLRDLPIHKVKLDRAFIQDIGTNRSNTAIVQGIITMAHHLDLVVVAEGIEEREQQQDLIRRNCDLLQGFYFARPMPREAIMELPEQLPVGL